LLKNEPTRFASHPEADHRLPPLSLIGSSAVEADPACLDVIAG
jgi:hypothetical protein